MRNGLDRPQPAALSAPRRETYGSRRGRWGYGLLRGLRRLFGTRGSQLVEFALTLPGISLMMVGVSDYSGAFLLKHRLGNAAREAARVVVSNPLTDQNCTDTTPCSVEAAADAASQYLTGVGLSASCITPKSPASSGNLTWTYTCASGLSLTINRGYTFTGSDGNPVQSTQVTLSYPYSWMLSGIFTGTSLPSSLSTSVVMENLD